MKVVVLAGGTGAAKFVRGLVRAIDPRDLSVIVNTGDDLEWWGLHVSPDLDTICYELGGLLDRQRGWGRLEETFHCRDAMRALGQASWFNVGDRDLSTHLFRTERLRAGVPLSEVTAALCARWGIASRILPMTDARVRTIVTMDDGDVPFQEFFVRRRHTGAVHAVRFEGASTAQPAPGVIDAIHHAAIVVIAPSNPVTSVGPILGVLGMTEALSTTSARTVAISPVVGSAAVSGPAARLMATRGWPTTAAGVAMAYRSFLDVLLCDVGDAALAGDIEKLDVQPVFTNILMSDTSMAEHLAKETLDAGAH